MSKIVAIILAGGKGERFNHDLPKQFVKLAGRSILSHTIGAFLNSDLISGVVVVAPKNFLEHTERIISGLRSRKPLTVVEGGDTRQKSSYRGLLACPGDADFVLIHDGVRPLLSQSLIHRVVLSVEKYGAVDTCIPTGDTIVARADQFIESIPDRSKLLRGQTPQAFRFDLISQAHEWALRNDRNDFTDDCGIVLAFGHGVFIELGEDRNTKITTINDLYIAERLFQLGEAVVPITDAQKWYAGKRALVIGGTGAIGSHIVRELEESGCDAMAVGRRTDPPVDVTNEESIRTLFGRVKRTWGDLDILVFSAGKMIVKDIKEITMSEWDEVYNVNLRGVFLVLKHMNSALKGDARVVILGSSSYSLGRAGYAAYSSSKSALINLVQASSIELPEFRINVASPQRVNSSLRAKNFTRKADLENLLEPAYVAKEVLAILPLCVTGSNFDIRKDHSLSERDTDAISSLAKK